MELEKAIVAEKGEKRGEEDDDVTGLILNFEKPPQKGDWMTKTGRDGPKAGKGGTKKSPDLLPGQQDKGPNEYIRELGQHNIEPNEYIRREVGLRNNRFSTLGLMSGED